MVGPDGTDTLTAVERLQFADGLYGIDGVPLPISGTDGANALVGTGSADTITGLGGDDIITGGSGNDTINGGAGADTAVFSGSMAASTVSTTGGTITVVGPDGTDTLTEIEYLRFNDGTLIVGAGGGQLIEGTAGNDVLEGTAFADDLRGDAGHDVLSGGGGADLLNGGAGDDTLYGIAGDDTLNGGAGRDQLYGGDGADRASYAGMATGVQVNLTDQTAWDGESSDLLASIENATGSDHADLLVGAAGVNELNGGAGDDTLYGIGGDDILTGGVGRDQLYGGDGADWALYADMATGVQVNLSEQAGWDGGAWDLLVSIENVTGSDHADILAGSADVNELNGGAGDDTLYGIGGDDTLNGGVGRDQLYGGDGADRASYAGMAAGVQVNLTDQTAWDGGAWDLIVSIENATGSDHADLLIGSADVNELSGGAGNDTLYGIGGDDILNGGAGQDQLYGGDGADWASYAGMATGVQVNLTDQTAWDGGSSDLLVSIENAMGSDQADLLVGSADANGLNGGAGDDTLYGIGGDDILNGGAGRDQLYGGDGADWASYAGMGTGVQVNLTDQTAWDGGASDLLVSIENAIGSDHADILSGSADANSLSGGAGDDTLYGIGGDDTLNGGAGRDQLYGGDGVDRVSYAGMATGVQVNLTDQTAWDGTVWDLIASIENATGSDHADLLVGAADVNELNGGAGDDTLYGIGGDDILNGGAGRDQLYGGDGADWASYAGMATGAQVNLGEQAGWDGGAWDLLVSIENVTGSDHADILAGSADANALNGGAGDDTLYGIGGDDILTGGVGRDQLYGGDGADRANYAGTSTGVQVNLTDQTAWDGGATDLLDSIENATGSDHADLLIGSSVANDLIGGAGNDTLYGIAGDDVLTGGAGQDQLYGGDGTDTAVYSGNRSAYTITVSGGVTTVVGPDGSDTLYSVERLQFADMVTNASGEPEAMPALAPAGPLVFPLMAGDKGGEGPEVLPVAFGDMAKDGAPQVLPAASGEVAKDAGPEVLPSAPGDSAKDAEPQTLPGETDGFPIFDRDQLTTSDFASRHGDIAATLSMFGDLPVDDGYLLAGISDAGSPEILPAIADDFVLTAKFEGPPVMPVLESDLDGAGLGRDVDFAEGLLRLLSREDSQNPHVSADGLTLPEDPSAIPSPTRHDVW